MKSGEENVQGGKVSGYTFCFYGWR